MNRILVFGGTGFIGSSLVEALIKKNYNVAVFGRNLKNLDYLKDSVEFIQGDFHNIEDIQNTLRKDDIVFDLITSSVPYTSMFSPSHEITQHILSHVQFIETACKIGVEKIIFTSSGGGIYGEKKHTELSEQEPPQPVSPHAISKITIEYFLEYFCKIYNIPHIIYRLSNPYGPRQQMKEGFGVIPTFFSFIKAEKQPILFNHGELIRDFIYIDDMAEALIIPLEKGNQHTLYNIGSGKGESIKHLWETIKEITGTPIEPIFKEKRPIDAESIILNISRFKDEFNWEPKTSLHDGLKTCWESI